MFWAYLFLSIDLCLSLYIIGEEQFIRIWFIGLRIGYLSFLCKVENGVGIITEFICNWFWSFKFTTLLIVLAWLLLLLFVSCWCCANVVSKGLLICGSYYVAAYCYWYSNCCFKQFDWSEGLRETLVLLLFLLFRLWYLGVVVKV